VIDSEAGWREVAAGYAPQSAAYFLARFAVFTFNIITVPDLAFCFLAA
jgi:hypothetical protein